MWLFFNDAFLSVVDNKEKKGYLTVRARFPEHIRNVFPKAFVHVTDNRDYLYRAYVRRKDIADAVLKRINELNYHNFKASVEDQRYHDACLGVWYEMFRATKEFHSFRRGLA